MQTLLSSIAVHKPHKSRAHELVITLPVIAFKFWPGVWHTACFDLWDCKFNVFLTVDHLAIVGFRASNRSGGLASALHIIICQSKERHTCNPEPCVSYTSRIVDELQYPAKLARFEWKQQASGGQSVRVFSPTNATTPVAEFTGLFTLPFSVPISNTSFFDPLLRDLLSTVQTVKNPSTGGITSKYVRDVLLVFQSSHFGGIHNPHFTEWGAGSLFQRCHSSWFSIPRWALGCECGTLHSYQLIIQDCTS
jgi:hypothetical protein